MSVFPDWNAYYLGTRAAGDEDVVDRLERDQLARARARRQTDTLTPGVTRATRVVLGRFEPDAAALHARNADPTSILEDET